MITDERQYETNYPAVARVALTRLSGLMILCVVMLAANAGTLFWVWRLQQRLQIPVNVSGGSAYVTPDALAGISVGETELMAELSALGQVQLQVVVNMVTKTPGSQVVALYRTAEGDPWQQVVAEQRELLQFAAVLPVAESTELVWYRAAEVVRGEVVRATRAQQYPLADFTTGRVYFRVVANWQNSGMTRFYIDGNAHIVTPYSVSEIVVRLVRTGGGEETRTLTTQSWFDTNPTGIDRLEVTVRYRDGEERQAVIRAPWEQRDGLLLTR